MTLQGAAVLLEALAVPIAAAAEPAAGSNTSSCSAEPEDAGVEALGSEAAAGEGASAAGFGSNGGAPPPGSRRPLWLRLEWNRISLEGLVQVGGSGQVQPRKPRQPGDGEHPPDHPSFMPPSLLLPHVCVCVCARRCWKSCTCGGGWWLTCPPPFGPMQVRVLTFFSFRMFYMIPVPSVAAIL